MIRFSKTTHGTDGVVLEVSSTKLMHQSVLETQDAQQLVRNGPSLPKHLTSHFEPHPHENVSSPCTIVFLQKPNRERFLLRAMPISFFCFFSFDNLSFKHLNWHFPFAILCSSHLKAS